MRFRTTSFFFALPLLVTGCTGLSLGEKQPGADTYLAAGDIAVDARTDTSFVLSTADGDPNHPSAAPKSALFAVNADSGAVTRVMDMTGRKDPRVLFPDIGVLVMSEVDGADTLRLFDPKTFTLIGSADENVRYNGTRMSQSRKWIAVADNTSAHAPIHVIDGSTLGHYVVPHGGDWLEAMWMNTRDRLMSIVFYDESLPTAHARILAWDMDKVSAGAFQADGSGFWPAPALDVDLPGVTGDDWFSFTWVGVSPDDHWVVFPVRDVTKSATQSYELVVLDTTTGTIRVVPDAKGPVGFTPDSATIVSYKDVDAKGNQELLLIDAKTLAVDPVSVPIQGGLSYFITHQGNYVVAGSATGGQRLVLYDVDNAKTTQMPGPGVGLTEFIARPDKGQVWLVDDASLFELDVNAGTFQTVSTSFSPEHINYQPKHDRLVLDGAGSSSLFFFDPDKQETVMTAPLPAP